MNVLLLSTSMGMGGADQQILSAARILRSRGHDVRIVSLTSLGPMGLEARESGIPTVSLEMPRGVPDPRGFLRLARIVRGHRPDVLHSHMVHANLMARALRVVVPVPVLVSTIHSIVEGGPALTWASRLTNRLVDRVTIVSDVAADRYVRDGLIPRALLRIIPNGVDVEAFQNVPAKTRAVLRDGLGLGDAFVWLAVGRFEAPKDYPTMLEGFARVRAQHSNTVLLVVGTGLLEQETALAARRLGLADAVRFLGTRRDIPELMSAADAYLMSSAWEGLPVVLLEAAAAALPIVTTAVGGTREVVLDRESGLLVPPRDPEGLAAAMRAIMELPHAQRNAMGERGRRHVRDRFGMVKIAADWEALYRELLASKGMPDAVPVAPPSPASLPDAGSSARERG